MSVKVGSPDYSTGGKYSINDSLSSKSDAMVPLLDASLDSYSSLEASVASTSSLYAPEFSYISTVSCCKKMVLFTLLLTSVLSKEL